MFVHVSVILLTGGGYFFGGGECSIFSGGGRGGSNFRYTVNVRPVRSLLECILVVSGTFDLFLHFVTSCVSITIDILFNPFKTMTKKSVNKCVTCKRGFSNCCLKNTLISDVTEKVWSDVDLARYVKKRSVRSVQERRHLDSSLTERINR